MPPAAWLAPRRRWPAHSRSSARLSRGRCCPHIVRPQARRRTHAVVAVTPACSRGLTLRALIPTRAGRCNLRRDRPDMSGVAEAVASRPPSTFRTALLTYRPNTARRSASWQQSMRQPGSWVPILSDFTAHRLQRMCSTPTYGSQLHRQKKPPEGGPCQPLLTQTRRRPVSVGVRQSNLRAAQVHERSLGLRQVSVLPLYLPTQILHRDRMSVRRPRFAWLAWRRD